MLTSSNKRLQEITEAYLKDKLQQHGHTIIGINVRRGKFEFDLVSAREMQLYVHEVRGTRQTSSKITDHFPTKKILTLLAGIESHFPQAQLVLHLVRVGRNQKFTSTSINASDFL